MILTMARERLFSQLMLASGDGVEPLANTTTREIRELLNMKAEFGTRQNKAMMPQNENAEVFLSVFESSGTGCMGRILSLRLMPMFLWHNLTTLPLIFQVLLSLDG